MELSDIIGQIDILNEKITFQSKDNSWSLAAEYLSSDAKNTHDVNVSTLPTTSC